VSCYVDRHIQDAEAWRDLDGHIHVGQQSIFTKFNIAINRLPDNFPERRRVPRTSLSKFDAELEDLSAAFHGEDRATTGIRRSAMSTHPVLVIGRISELENDIKLATSIGAFKRRHPRGVIAPGHGLDKWFQHPAIVVEKTAQALNQLWLDSVRPRLVVRVGRMGLIQPLANKWPNTPEVVVLSRRAPSSVDAIEIIRAMSWKAVTHLEKWPEILAPRSLGSSIEAEWFIEDVSSTEQITDWHEDDW
jgi:hypothetical protein